MPTGKKDLQKDFNSNFRHPAGGYYHEGVKGKGDPDRGKTKRQKKTQRKKPLPGGYPNLGKIG